MRVRFWVKEGQKVPIRYFSSKFLRKCVTINVYDAYSDFNFVHDDIFMNAFLFIIVDANQK